MQFDNNQTVSKKPNYYLFPITAKNSDELRKVADRLSSHLLLEEKQSLPDLAYTYQIGKRMFDYRLALTVNSSEQLAQLCEEISRTEGNIPDTFYSNVKSKKDVVFMFTGQGSQYSGMGKILYESSSVIKNTLDECEEILKGHLPQPLLQYLFSEQLGKELNDTRITQPALFALEYALAKLWMSWGIQPTMMIGHSLGEYVAACVGGGLTLKEGLLLVMNRGRLMHELCEQGAMVSLIGSVEEVKYFLDSTKGLVDISAINSSNQVVISGTRDGVDHLCELWEQNGGVFKKLPVSHAFHSFMMEPMLKEFSKYLEKIDWQPLKYPIVSNFAGELETIMGSDYWCKQLRNPVQFLKGIKWLNKSDIDVFLEIGPQPILHNLCMKEVGGNRLFLKSLDSQKPDWNTLLSSVGKAWCYGVDLDLRALSSDFKYSRVHVPTYPFSNKEYSMNQKEEIFGSNINRLNSIDIEIKQSDLCTNKNINIEEILMSFFYDVLGVNNIGINGDFFELGGDSLNAIQLQARIQKEFDVDLTLEDLFQLRSIDKLTGKIKTIQKEMKVKSEDIKIDNIPSMQKQQNYVLSNAQQRIYFLSKMHTDEAFYNLPSAMILQGDLDVEILKTAIKKTFDRHEQLRANFDIKGEKLVQIIDEKMVLDIPVIDWSHYNMNEQKKMQLEMLLEESKLIFNLEDGPLFRVCIVKLGSNRNMLLINAHHIVFDAWSMNILLRDINEFYKYLTVNKVPNLPKINLRYVEYANWFLSDKKNEEFLKSRDFWHNQLDGELPVLDLSQDYLRPRVQNYKGASHQRYLDRYLVKGLHKLARKYNSTMYTLLLTAFQVMLHRYSGQTDIIVGTSVAGRNEQSTENVIGMFVNTVAMRLDMSDNPCFNDLLEQARSLTLEVLSHQDYPFDKLVEELKPLRDESRSPIFSVLFSMLKHTQGEKDFCGNTVEAIQPQSVFSKFDLTLMASEDENGISLYLEYSTALFKDSTISRMMDNFIHLLNSIVESPISRISELDILSVREKKRLLSYNEPKTFYSQKETVHSLLSKQAKYNSQKIAIRYKDEALTFGELDEQSNALAHYLRKIGIGTETHVAIMCDRSPQLVVSILGILKAGGTYIPIDPSYPTERINYLLEDSEASIVITQQSFIYSINNFRGQCVTIEEMNTKIMEYSIAPLLENSSAENLAYIIYTSGSTGSPKGVQVKHSGLVNYLKQAKSIYNSDKEGSFPLYSSISFDLTVTSLFLPLITGNTIFIQPAELEGITLITKMAGVDDFMSAKFTPAHLELLIQDAKINGTGMKGLRNVIVGGESLSPELVRSWFSYYPQTILYNEYGPTETVVGCIVQRLSPEMKFDRNIVPIGRPINNMKVYLFDNQKQPVPIGVKGEIYIGGPGVARGYLNKNHQTNRVFLENEVIPGEILYKTGDIARYLEDGTLEYLGRLDNQVKIRGFRIELEEIRLTLLKHIAIIDCLITTDIDSSGDKRLLAYIVTRTKVSNNEILSFLEKYLPEYMIPNRIISISNIPLTTNGKVDFNGLPPIDMSEVIVDENPRSEVIMSENEIQNWIAELWKESLGLNSISLKADFFNIGGHSLKILPIIVKIKPKFPNVQVQDFFTHRTIESLGRFLYLNHQKTNGFVNEHELSKGKLQEWILDLWKETLELDEIDIYDDFFKIGGHSLKILPIIVKIKQNYPKIQVQDFFTYRNVASLTEFLFCKEDILEINQLDAGCGNDSNMLSELITLDSETEESSTCEMFTRIEPNAVLLTGGTGFLGAHVLYELLEQTSAHVYCLVRPSTKLSLLERINNKMEYYFGETVRDRIKDRVTVINADLGKTELGISMEHMRLIKEHVDMIIHCAADVRHYGDEKHFDKINVGGTKRLLELAKEIPNVHFHYVSTISIVGWSKNDPDEYILYEKDFDRGQVLDNVYTKSKFNAEKLVREANNNGIPASIYRVGNLVAHSKSGQFQQNIETDAFYRILKAFILLGVAPKSLGELDLTPIDYCSQALVKLAIQKESIGETFHLCNPKHLTLEGLAHLLQSFGYSLTLLKPEKFNEFLFSENRPIDHEKALELIIAQQEGSAVAGKIVRIDSQKTNLALDKLGVNCPEPNRNFIYLILKNAIERGFIPMPKLWDIIEYEKEESATL
ncbi:non-ribosomal peptide synthetase [Sporosarcina limicola]|uniref:Amino acid adenylation domain-containing protein/thioester reductase-like protein n=1 Tax=Sporosarcina limicola TaxID=34101 RepID=A0A927MLC6_9BACL|nr:non-ribosomal peptide synthetase [Sporosarcina limicola]MBE1556834.1 amino acid adenylation domain-containing protein/thioester reductase-like protein [Sporosarcina limicola]